jgi:hypothetical protein
VTYVKQPQRHINGAACLKAAALSKQRKSHASINRAAPRLKAGKKKLKYLYRKNK